MEIPKVAIIGWLGKYGQCLDRFFNGLIPKVLVASVFGSDLGTKESNKALNYETPL